MLTTEKYLTELKFNFQIIAKRKRPEGRLLNVL